MIITCSSEIPDAPFYVVANDTFMSGWGKAEGKVNTVILPCANRAEADAVARYARSRDEMTSIRILESKPSLDSGTVYSLMTRGKALAWYPEVTK